MITKGMALHRGMHSRLCLFKGSFGARATRLCIEPYRHSRSQARAASRSSALKWLEFSHVDKVMGLMVRVSGAGGRYPSVLCGRWVL